MAIQESQKITTVIFIQTKSISPGKENKFSLISGRLKPKKIISVNFKGININVNI